MPSPQLIHIGSAVIDFIYSIERLPGPGDDLTASSFAALPGGGFNVMVAARRSGMNVAFAGKTGDGLCGAMLRNALGAERIACLQPPSIGIDTGNCVVLVTADAERSFVSKPGAEGVIAEADFTFMQPEPGDWVFTSGYTLAYSGSRDAQAQFICQLPTDAVFAFDPTAIIHEIPEDILANVLARTDWLSLNRDEAVLIAGPGSDEELAQRLLSAHCPQAKGVLIRAGALGALLALRDQAPVFVPAFAVEAVDTNGAGDTHVGAFIAALVQGRSPVEAVRYANAAAAISTTRQGGSVAPTGSEIEAFLDAFRPVDSKEG